MKSITFAVLLCIFSLSTAQFRDVTEDDFLKASERCFKSEKLAQSYQQQFDRFHYPDEPAVHRFLHCAWTQLNLWTDGAGFNVERIAELYKDKANTEILVPILTECNRNTRNDPPLRWCYKSFICILNSRVGGWFKEDIEKKLKERE